MNAALLLTQVLNGLQFGILLFVLSAGLTLVLGIMNVVNLAHGALYMVGAYAAAAAYGHTESFAAAVVAAVLVTLALGWVLERTILGRLQGHGHLEQVLATFGLILFFNELVRLIWGPSPLFIGLPESLSGTFQILGFSYSSYRILVIAVGLLVALALYLVIHRTRVGMLIRAGAGNATMVSALGVNIRALNALVFTAGAGLAGLAGVMAAPILSVQPAMGESVLILTLVVIITGGIGSIRGAFFGALIVGVVDTLGRVLMPGWFSAVFERSIAQAAGPALASMLIYILMAAVLAFRPQGLFPVRHG